MKYTDFVDPVIFIQLALPPIEPLTGFSVHTSLLSTPHEFRTHAVLAFIEKSLRKDATLSGVFNEVKPLNGGWNLELALDLPDMLPTLEGKSEALVPVKANAGDTRTLCMSNRMSRFHYQDGATAFHALVPRTAPWHGALQITRPGGPSISAAEEILGTTMAMTFPISGSDTENALETNIGKCLDIFLAAITIVVQATRECSKGTAPIVSAVARDAIPFVYVHISGSPEPRGARLMLSRPRAGLNVPQLSGDGAKRFRAIANGEEVLNDVDMLIGRAQSSAEAGEYEFAFLQTVIAAEIITMRCINAECKRRGVSNNKLKDAEKDITYSWALNIGLKLALPEKRRPKDDLLNAMNVARERRNGLMHKGEFKMNRSDVRKLIEETRAYVAVLSKPPESDQAGSASSADAGR